MDKQTCDATGPTVEAIRDLEYRQMEAQRSVTNLGKATEPFYPPSEQCAAGSFSPPSEDINLSNVDDVMRYQPWDRFQAEQGDQVREALTLAAKTILRNCPPGRFRSVALRQIIDARMNANAAISFNGRF